MLQRLQARTPPKGAPSLHWKGSVRAACAANRPNKPGFRAVFRALQPAGVKSMPVSASPVISTLCAFSAICAASTPSDVCV